MLKLYITHLIITMGLCSPIPCGNADVIIQNQIPSLNETTTVSSMEYKPRQMMCMAKVIENTSGVVFFDTLDGNACVVKSDDQIYEVGKQCLIMFDTKLTDDIYDDTIINILPNSEV